MSRRKRQLISIALGALVGAFCLGLGQLSAFRTLERQTIDYRFRLRAKEFPESPIVLVFIDDEALKCLGKFWLDGQDYEMLTQRLINLGAKMIVFDTFFMERPGSQMVESLGQKRDGVHILYPLRFVLRQNRTRTPQASYVIAPYTDVDRDHLGHTNLYPDPDGILRKARDSIDFEGVSYPFLPLLAVGHYLGDKVQRIPVAQIDQRGDLGINYYTRTSRLQEVSAAWILNLDRVDRQDYKDKIVLVGRRTSALVDTISTPIQEDCPITRLYATLMTNILHRDLLRSPPPLILAMIVLFLGGLVGWMVASLRPVMNFILFLAILGLYLAIAFLGFMFNLVMEVLSPGLTIIFGYLCVTILNYSIEERILSTSLARARLYHKSVIESMTSGLIVIDMAGRVITLNERAQEILGIKRDVTGVIYQELLGVGRLREILEEAFIEGSRVKEEEEIVFNGRRLVTSGTVLRDERGEAIGAMIIFQDVSEIRQLQERIKLKERLAAIGELAAGVAHEFRNPLGAITSSAKLLSQSLDPSNRYLQIILKESEVLSSLIEEFLYFSRPAKLSLSLVDVNSLIEDTLSLLREDTDKTGVVVQKDLKEILPLRIDPSQIKRALINLIQNGLEAMEREGELRIASSQLRDEGMVKIEISDTGPGIKEEDLSRIFDPFFTTRAEGTGLGLAIVHKIIEDHKGRIECQSKIGQGTNFSIYLPVN